MKKPNEVVKPDTKIVFDPEIDYLNGLQTLGSKYLDEYMEDSRANQRHVEQLEKIEKANETLKIQNEFKAKWINPIIGLSGLIVILGFTFGFALAGFKDLALGIGATLIASAGVIAAITGYKNKKQ